MKKLLVPIMVLALVALTVPVWAGAGDCYSAPQCNISLDGSVTFSKCVTIHETQCDTYFTTTFACFEPQARADAEAIKNDSNNGNCLTIGALLLKDPQFTDTMCSSFDGFTGIGQSNQSAGSMNNQGNAVAVAYVGNSKTYASSLAAVGDDNFNNNITYSFSPCTTSQADNMNCSFNCFTGIGQSNQSAGSMNNLNNVVSIAAGVAEQSGCKSVEDSSICSGSVAVASSDLALNNCGNRMDVCGNVCFSNSMTGSYNNFTGIGQSNQAAGNMNNQVNVISVAASVSK